MAPYISDAFCSQAQNELKILAQPEFEKSIQINSLGDRRRRRCRSLLNEHSRDLPPCNPNLHAAPLGQTARIFVKRYARQVCPAELPSRVSFRPPGYEAAAIFSLVPDSGTSAAAFRPSWTLGTVAFTSVIGSPCVGPIVFTPSRSIR